jgi:hypothetical protein
VTMMAMSRMVFSERVSDSESNDVHGKQQEG